MKEIFETIYKTGGWYSPESLSGVGSTVKATENIRKFLKEKFAGKKICDIPCGDFNWMKHIVDCFESYCGVDIVPHVIGSNTLHYAKGNVKFMTGDICTFNFSNIQADLLIVRDCLVHLSKDSILQALKNICSSTAEYALITHFTNERSFIEIQTGSWRPLNMCQPPLNLPEPIEVINEGWMDNDKVHSDKSMGLWKISEIRKTLA